jgi:hypothetical protein
LGERIVARACRSGGSRAPPSVVAASTISDFVRFIANRVASAFDVAPDALYGVAAAQQRHEGRSDQR